MRTSLIAAALAASFSFAAPARAADKKFALAMFHFNVQYVAGGTIGFGGPSSERSPTQIEDLIVTESLEPVLDLYLAHPTWGQDIEMQGYMLEVIGERHPRVLEKLKKLVDAGQIDVDSFHYSDQLFIAYPRVDWDRSQTLNDEVFAKYGVKRGASVFCQEGQVGVGMAAAMTEHGYRTLVWPPNHFKFQHGEADPAPLYLFGEAARVVVGRDAKTRASTDNVEAVWTFLDDGELLATGNSNPYLVSAFRRDEAALKAYEDKLATLEAAGFRVTPVARYVAALEESGTAPVPMPPMLDGTWQPQSTDGTHKWLGGKGGFVKDERDNDVRTLAAIAHRELVAAETIARTSGLDASAELASAWRLLLLGQVSDATGINPIRGEIEYGLSHASEAMRIARDVIARSKEKRGDAHVAIDVDTGAVGATNAPTTSDVGGRSIARGPFEPVVTASGRAVTVRWAELEPDHFVLDIAFGAGDERVAETRIPGAAGDILYTPALTSTPAHLSRADFAFESFTLPLFDGLIGLAPDLFLVKDLAYVHVGARITRTSGDVVFGDDTMPAGEPTTWRFHVVRGSESRAGAIARTLNVSPKVVR